MIDEPRTVKWTPGCGWYWQAGMMTSTGPVRAVFRNENVQTEKDEIIIPSLRSPGRVISVSKAELLVDHPATIGCLTAQARVATGDTRAWVQQVHDGDGDPREALWHFEANGFGWHRKTEGALLLAVLKSCADKKEKTDDRN